MNSILNDNVYLIDINKNTIKKSFELNSLATCFPNISCEWHSTKNHDKHPENFKPNSNKIVWWQCSQNITHEWQASISNRTGINKTGCPVCVNRKVNSKNSLKVCNPELASEWHPTKNNGLSASQVPPSGKTKAWWLCKKNSTHEWQQTINARSSGVGCPFCDGKQVDPNNSLKSKFPDIATEWHPTKNNGLLPNDFMPFSGKSAWWVCTNKRKKHPAYRAIINNRTSKNAGCPICKNQASVFEIRLRAELETIFDEVKPRLKIDGKEVDIYLPSICLCIEVDGGYFHKDSYELDEQKNQHLKKLSLECLRIRGYELEKIGTNDIQISKKEEKQPNFEIIKKILKTIRTYTSNEIIVNKIEHYFSTNQFQNDKRFNELRQDISQPRQGNDLI